MGKSESVVGKPVGVSDQVQHKPGCTATEYGYQISNLGSRGIEPRSWAASLFSYMQKAGFLTTRLKLHRRIRMMLW